MEFCFAECFCRYTLSSFFHTDVRTPSIWPCRRHWSIFEHKLIPLIVCTSRWLMPLIHPSRRRSILCPCSTLNSWIMLLSSQPPVWLLHLVPLNSLKNSELPPQLARILSNTHSPCVSICHMSCSSLENSSLALVSRLCPFSPLPFFPLSLLFSLPLL